MLNKIVPNNFSEWCEKCERPMFEVAHKRGVIIALGHDCGKKLKVRNNFYPLISNFQLFNDELLRDDAPQLPIQNTMLITNL